MRRLILTSIVLFGVVSIARAGESIASSTVYWENDVFPVGRKTDRFYTNGLRFTLDLAQSPSWATEVRRRFCGRGWCGDRDMSESVGISLGQNFYTPEIITIAAPQPLDRPWAGSLYVSISETLVDSEELVQHVMEVSAGVLGPGAGAQRVQKFVHNDLGFSDNDPQGWRNQLPNEPTLALMYQQARRTLRSGDVFDVVPKFGGMLGSPLTYLNAGGVLRLGYHLSGFPSGLIPGAAAAADRLPRCEAYLFLGGDARWVPFNATLDGGLFHDGIEANGPKRFVTDLRYGISARYKRLRLTYSVVDRSAEFHVPPGHLGTQHFGSYAFAVEPRRAYF